MSSPQHPIDWPTSHEILFPRTMLSKMPGLCGPKHDSCLLVSSIRTDEVEIQYFAEPLAGALN